MAAQEHVIQEPYFRFPGLGPDCSTPRTAALRERRFRMYYEKRQEPAEYTALADRARQIYLDAEVRDPALARAQALRHVVENCPITLEKDAFLVGGENPFFFNLLLPALQADRYSREGRNPPDETSARLRSAQVFNAPCFEGHITPGLEFVLGQGVAGLRQRIVEQRRNLQMAGGDPDREHCYEAMLAGCESVLIFARRQRTNALELAATTADAAWAAELRQAADALARVPEQPATTFHEALQAYWIVYCLVTVEMGGCCPGGGLGLGRLDQSLYPYFRRDLDEGRLNRAQALELMELFLLNFRHCDYYTWHALYTPGSQTSLGGVTPTGAEAANELTELIMEASLRLQNPTPYVSLRLHRTAPERYWQAAANFVAGGLGFAVVNDEALIPAFLRHERSLADARDYICSCCYENTIPGREAFNPNCAYLNLPLVLELALNRGRSLVQDEMLGTGSEPADFATFADLLTAFRDELHHVCRHVAATVNHADANHCRWRRYPLMSVFMEDCIARGQDVCAGGARYNLSGIIVAGLPNVVNTLAAIRTVVFEQKTADFSELRNALQADFAGHEPLRHALLAAPKWGNDDAEADSLATAVAETLYAEFCGVRNPRGGRFQLALYSFVANYGLGECVGASADGRLARQPLTRNLNPAWGTDRQGPTAVLKSLSHIDFTAFPNGCSLDLRFDPALAQTRQGRQTFAAFLKSFVDLGVMQMQISMVDTATLLDARTHPEKYPSLMVKVAGYSARFVDLSAPEQEEIINRSEQRLMHSRV